MSNVGSKLLWDYLPTVPLREYTDWRMEWTRKTYFKGENGRNYFHYEGFEFGSRRLTFVDPDDKDPRPHLPSYTCGRTLPVFLPVCPSRTVHDHQDRPGLNDPGRNGWRGSYLKPESKLHKSTLTLLGKGVRSPYRFFEIDLPRGPKGWVVGDHNLVRHRPVLPPLSSLCFHSSPTPV